jgi:nucleoside 2-deoxyribosyltransferase
MTRPALIYIAGPFRAATPWEVEANVRRAEALSVAVARMPMLFPVCPHTMGRFLSGAAPDEVWLEGDLELMRRCDAVLLVLDWQRSSGTRAEVTEAHRVGLPVFVATAPQAWGEDTTSWECWRLWPEQTESDRDSTLADWWIERRKAS